MHEKSIKKTEAFAGKLISVEQHDVELDDGARTYREIVRHPGSVGVLARDVDGKFVFVRQYRMGAEKVMTEVIAGLLDAGESPESAARRELLEETGQEAASLEHLGTIFASPGYIDEKVDIYLAELKKGTVELNLDHGERIEVVKITRQEFERAVRDGEIEDSKTLATWALFTQQETR